MVLNIEKRFNEIIQLLEKSKSMQTEILNVSDQIINCLEKDGKVIVMGNGGSAADSQHFVAEFIGRYKIERKSIAAIALTTDTSIITAIGNDYEFEQIFSRQCESLAKHNDILIAISTSGNSKNIVKALKESQKKVAKIVGITGEKKGKMEKYCDIVLKIPSKDTPQIQEVHRIVLHMICEIVEKKIFENS